MMKKRIKAGGAAVLVMALALSTFVLPKVYAARELEVSRACSVQVTVPVEEFSELGTLPVEIHLYKVADVNVQGEYSAVDVFETLNFSDISSETKAAEWEEKAMEAKALVTEETEKAAVNTLVDGVGSATRLETGLYLVDAQQILSDTYQYDFKPYLISLPNNYYYATQNDDWVYDLTGENAIVLKPEKTDLYGDLVIEKTLDTYNATVGGATFVFQVEGFKEDIDTGEKREVYSNVLSMTFTGPGTESITIKDLPAGAEVVVTEIYAGASYELTSDENQTVIIVTNESEEAPAKVAFSNTYNDEMNGGSGIVNSFTFDSETGSWTHTATQDSIQ